MPHGSYCPKGTSNALQPTSYEPYTYLVTHDANVVLWVHAPFLRLPSLPQVRVLRVEVSGEASLSGRRGQAFFDCLRLGGCLQILAVGMQLGSRFLSVLWALDFWQLPMACRSSRGAVPLRPRSGGTGGGYEGSASLAFSDLSFAKPWTPCCRQRVSTGPQAEDTLVARQTVTS